MSYDANGNILKYKRNKDAGVTQDSLNYKYNAGTNQLQYITDNVANNVSSTDIDGQLPNNYIYDKSGNMVADNSQSMSVSWSPYGKILTNTKAGGASLAFGYNAMQQRVLKRVVLAGDTTRTYYIRDAQGNTMDVYTRHNDSVSWREQYIFGSSRLGLYRADTLVNKGLRSISKLYEGKRNYELTNHLGNVMAVINDRKTDSLSGTTKVGFNAVVISATDYYPFGMAIDSRSYTSSLYRYGFNGKENDKETGEQDYGMRIYDPRIAKFLSVDPLMKKYPELSTYAFAGNTPIQAIDLDGREPWYNKERMFSITYYNLFCHKTDMLNDMATKDNSKFQSDAINKLTTFQNDNNKLYANFRRNGIGKQAEFGSDAEGFFDCITAVVASLRILKNDNSIKANKDTNPINNNSGNILESMKKWKNEGLLDKNDIVSENNNASNNKKIGEIVPQQDFNINIADKMIGIAGKTVGTTFFVMALGGDDHSAIASLTVNIDGSQMFNLYDQLRNPAAGSNMSAQKFNERISNFMWRNSSSPVDKDNFKDTDPRRYNPSRKGVNNGNIPEGNIKVTANKIIK